MLAIQEEHAHTGHRYEGIYTLPENDPQYSLKLAKRARRWPQSMTVTDISALADEVIRLTPKKVGKPPIVKAQVEIAGTPYEIRLTAQERK